MVGEHQNWWANPRTGGRAPELVGEDKQYLVPSPDNLCQPPAPWGRVRGRRGPCGLWPGGAPAAKCPWTNTRIGERAPEPVGEHRNWWAKTSNTLCRAPRTCASPRHPVAGFGVGKLRAGSGRAGRRGPSARGRTEELVSKHQNWWASTSNTLCRAPRTCASPRRPVAGVGVGEVHAGSGRAGAGGEVPVDEHKNWRASTGTGGRRQAIPCAEPR